MADIHANLEALQAVLADAMGFGCAQFAFLGDFVGYGADPKACLSLVRGLNAPCVKGNHDEYSASDLPLENFNPIAAKGVQWTRTQLTEDERQWLRALPYVVVARDFTLVHANLARPDLWGYVFEKVAAAASFASQTTPLCFFGHTHVPAAFIQETAVRGGTYGKFKVDPAKRYFVNPGSVGQSRDGNRKATYAIYNEDERTIELRRVPYDTEAAQKKMRAAGLGD